MRLIRRAVISAGSAAAAAALLPTHTAHAAAPAPEPRQPYTGPVPSGEALCFLPATVQLELLRRRAVSAVELTRAHLERIARVNPAINAFVYLVSPQLVLAAAQQADRRYRARTNRPLEGLLLAVKTVGTRGVARPRPRPPLAPVITASLPGSGRVPAAFRGQVEYRQPRLFFSRTPRAAVLLQR